MNKTTSNQSISFEQDAKLVRQLLTLLSREQSSLVSIDLDSIEALIEEKSVLLQKISALADNRYKALATAGFEENESGMVAWLKYNATPALNKSWESFQKSILEAKELNRLNGTLINKHFNRNQQLLNQLQGNAAGDFVYGKDGQAKTQSSTRSALTA